MPRRLRSNVVAGPWAKPRQPRQWLSPLVTHQMFELGVMPAEFERRFVSPGGRVNWYAVARTRAEVDAAELRAHWEGRDVATGDPSTRRRSRNPADVVAQRFCRATGSLCRAYRKLLDLGDPELTELICAEILTALTTPMRPTDLPETDDLLRAIAGVLATEAMRQRLAMAPGEPPPGEEMEEEEQAA